jgi:hypothetical protein
MKRLQDCQHSGFGSDPLGQGDAVLDSFQTVEDLTSSIGLAFGGTAAVRKRGWPGFDRGGRTTVDRTIWPVRSVALHPVLAGSFHRRIKA